MEIFDTSFKSLKYMDVGNCFCGLVHDGFIFIGGWYGITVVSEQSLTVVNK